MVSHRNKERSAKRFMIIITRSSDRGFDASGSLIQVGPNLATIERVSRLGTCARAREALLIPCGLPRLGLRKEPKGIRTYTMIY